MLYNSANKYIIMLLLFPNCTKKYIFLDLAIGMNNAIAPFDDIFVRQAFASAIDIGKITDITYKKMLPQASGILPPGMYGYDASKKVYETAVM